VRRSRGREAPGEPGVPSAPFDQLPRPDVAQRCVYPRRMRRLVSLPLMPACVPVPVHSLAQVQALGMWDNVGVPRSKWGTKPEPGPEWYNNAGAPQ